MSIKSIAQVKRDNAEYVSLIDAVLNGIDKEQIEDINNHGIDGGYGDFIYHSDTIAFWQKNREQIKKMLNNLTDELGESTIEIVRNFNCLVDKRDNKRTPFYTLDEIASVIYGNGDDVQIQNALAWFAAEEVCRMFEK